VRRPERERIVLQCGEGIVVDDDQRRVLRNVTLAGEQVPAVGVQVLERALPAGARKRRRKDPGQQRDRDQAGAGGRRQLQLRASAISRLQGA